MGRLFLYSMGGWQGSKESELFQRMPGLHAQDLSQAVQAEGAAGVWLGLPCPSHPHVTTGGPRSTEPVDEPSWRCYLVTVTLMLDPRW